MWYSDTIAVSHASLVLGNFVGVVLGYFKELTVDSIDATTDMVRRMARGLGRSRHNER